MQRVLRLAIVAVLVAVLPACALLRGDTGLVRPPLETPEPPPREVLVLPAVPVEAGPTPVIVPAGQAPGRTPRPLPPKAADKAEPQPAVIPVDPVTVRPAEPAAGSMLQTTPDVDAAERRVRDLLARAARDLSQLDYRALSQSGKTQYDAARRFMAQADDALKAGNLRFAEQLADKAAGLAAGLKGR
ncbi:MAG: hypothetical protein Q7V01_03370 [Vicinamibacterales bacterium]|nr:hypothetical protein [Vicinamibacterales bacterium]